MSKDTINGVNEAFIGDGSATDRAIRKALLHLSARAMREGDARLGDDPMEVVRAIRDDCDRLITRENLSSLAGHVTQAEESNEKARADMEAYFASLRKVRK